MNKIYSIFFFTVYPEYPVSIERNSWLWEEIKLLWLLVTNGETEEVYGRSRRKIKYKAVPNITANLIRHYASMPNLNEWWILVQVQSLANKIDTIRGRSNYVQFKTMDIAVETTTQE